jgi:hypothetical protein
MAGTAGTHQTIHFGFFSSYFKGISAKVECIVGRAVDHTLLVLVIGKRFYKAFHIFFDML